MTKEEILSVLRNINDNISHEHRPDEIYEFIEKHFLLIDVSDFWYYFGKCTPYPKQIPSGTHPQPPYKAFKTYEECKKYIDEIK
jgi:hypothetical protein